MSSPRLSDSPIQTAHSGAGLSPRLLAAPGGNLWWYVDLVDNNGDGLVVIWSFGLPFLPGYAAAARRQTPQLPGERPSLNVATYREGELDFYLLQEFGPREVYWQQLDDGDRWTFGDSLLESVVVDGRRRVALDLELDVPRLADDVDLTLTADGPAIHRPDEAHDPSIRRTSPLPDHDWAPLLCGCTAEAKLETGDKTHRWTGRLYHDRNGGRRPVHELDIKRWMWGRIPLPDRDFIYYVVDGDHHSRSLFWIIDDDGLVVPFDARLHRADRCKTFGGLSWWPSMTIEHRDSPWLEIEHRDVVDSGPFYLRSLPEAVDHRGITRRGVAEICEPDRIDLARFRPLIQMRVHRRSGPNSMWLPLFCGPRRGRLRRLATSLVDHLLSP